MTCLLRRLPVAVFAAALTLAVGIAPPARAADAPKVLGTYTAWTAYASEESGGKLCFIVSDPKEKKLSRVGRRRGDVHFLVSHWPDQQIFGQPSIIIGYPFAPNSSPTVRIGSDRFELVLDPDNEAHEERAWVPDAETETKMIAAMRRGSNMTVSARSSSGTTSTDTYSLLGFTAAMERIDRECK